MFPMRPALLPALALLCAMPVVPWVESHAETRAEARADSLRAALDAAWARTAAAQAHEARRGSVAAQARLADDWLAGPPVLDAELRSDRATGNHGARELDLGVELPLWQAGEAEARARLAGHDAERLDAAQLAQRLTLAGQVREAAWTLRLAEAAQRHALRREREAGRLEADATRRVRAGELAEAEALAARDVRLAARLARLDADAALAEARRDWQALTGLDALPRRIDERAAQEPQLHPERLAALAASRAAAGRVELAGRSAEERTKLRFGVRGERAARGEDEDYSLAVAVSIPFGGERFRRAEVESARAELAEAAAEEARLADTLPGALAAVRAQLALERERLAALQTRQSLARERSRLAGRAHDLGQLDLPALLQARAAAIEVEAEAELQGLRVARAVARLNQTQGVLP